MGIKSNNNYYLRYQDQYYSPALMQIYFGSIFIDDVVFLEYAVSNDKQPLYGYSSSMLDAVARGRVLVTGSIAINFTRTPLIQTIIDYIKRDNRLTETNFINDISEEEIRAANIASYYRYTHADLAYPVGYVEGTDKADQFNEMSEAINQLLAQKQALILKDPLISYPDHPGHDQIKELEDRIEEKQNSYYEEFGVKAFNTQYSEKGKLTAPQFLNATNTPFGGFYVTKDGSPAPFVLQKSISTALQKMNPSDQSKLLTQMKSDTLNEFLKKLEMRLMSGPNIKKSRIKRIDEHDIAIDQFMNRYVEMNTFDIVCIYGDVNTPTANSTVKVINDVHFVGESQSNNLDSAPILQRLTFFARNIDERPLNDIIDQSTGELMVGSPDDMTIMDERNAIQLGDKQYKNVEWLYGHLEDAPFSYNHKQDYRPKVVEVPYAEKLPHVTPLPSGPTKITHHGTPGPTGENPIVNVFPVIDTCNKLGDNKEVVKIGVVANLIDPDYVRKLKAGPNSNVKEPLPDDTSISIKVKLHVIRNNKAEGTPLSGEELAIYNSLFPVGEEVRKSTGYLSDSDVAPSESSITSDTSIDDETIDYVTGVHDGDTIYTQKRNDPIRLLYIDTPEIPPTVSEPEYLGIEARDYLKSQILNKNIRIICKGTDKYNRNLCEIYPADADITDIKNSYNYKLVELGYACPFMTDNEDIINIAREARDNKIGIFSDESTYTCRDSF